jgi:hypothetical protein
MCVVGSALPWRCLVADGSYVAEDYGAFVARKLAVQPPTGLERVPELHETLFPHQRDLVRWSLRRGRAAIFANTALAFDGASA